MFSDGFTDLRLNHQHGQVDDSFWPSFTDIMTVIVMIFLLAMVVVMIRNSELIQQLRATMEAERQAEELVRETSMEKESLATHMVELEHQLSMLRMEMMRVTEQRDETRDTLNRRENELTGLRAEHQATQTELDSTRSKLKEQTQKSQQLTQELQLANQNLQQSNQQRNTLTLQLNETRDSLDELQQEYRQQSQQLQAVTVKAELSAQSLAALETDYDDLKVKYDKLVKPARTSKNKQIVEIRKLKQDGRVVLELKKPADADFVVVSEPALYEQLTALKAKHPQSLYIKIIFPEDSGLSYSEAWEFTSELLKKYDYYYQ